MKKSILISLSIFISANLISCSNPANNSVNTISQLSLDNQNKQTKETLIVRFNKDVSKNEIDLLNKELKVQSVDYISKDLNIFSIQANPEQITNLKKSYQQSSFVKYATVDSKLSVFPYKVYPDDGKFTFNTKNNGYAPNDPYYSEQWNASDIDADKAWAITTGSKDITVAVIDSGVDPDHPDLKANLLPLIDIWNESGQTDKLRVGLSTIDYTGMDGNGHGTHVTGIIGAVVNNNTGIAGIAGNVKILPIKAANYKGDTYASVIAKAITRAIDEGVKVINISIGGPKSEGTQALQDAVELAISKGIVFVSATGNESDRAKGSITDVTVPAAYPGVLAVAATTEFDKIANYSNGGSETSVAAPGGAGADNEGRKIYSTWPTYKTYISYTENIIGPYAYISGTSMSSPHVAGIAALVLSREPDLTVQKVRVRILSTAKEIGNRGFDESSGYGKVNAYDALVKNTDDKS